MEKSFAAIVFDLVKSQVKAHQSKTKTGKVVNVRAHSNKVVKKTTVKPVPRKKAASAPSREDEFYAKKFESYRDEVGKTMSSFQTNHWAIGKLFLNYPSDRPMPAELKAAHDGIESLLHDFRNHFLPKAEDPRTAPDDLPRTMIAMRKKIRELRAQAESASDWH